MTEISTERLAHLVRALERLFRRDLEVRLEAHGVLFGHWEFLRILWQEEGLSQRELADRAGLTTPTVHTALHKMEALELIERRIPEGGVKRPVIHLTKKGRALEAPLVAEAVKANARAVEGVAEADLTVFRRTLLHMMDNLED